MMGNRKRKTEDLVLLGYPGISGSRFLWKKWEERAGQDSSIFSPRYVREERRRIEKLPVLFWHADKRSFSARNILLFTDLARQGEPIPLYEKDMQAKENAGEIERGEVESLFPALFERFSVQEVYPLGAGGILSGLWYIGGEGLSFSYEKIFFLQSTIELCEAFQESPYTLDSEGAFLLRMESGEDFSDFARERGSAAARIGTFQEGRKRMRKDAYGESYLYRPDEESMEK